MSINKLVEAILSLSQASSWDEAKLEWELIEIEQVKEGQECPCGHFPIKEICTISNKVTKKEMELGNCCAKKFDSGMHKIIPAIKKINKKIDASVNSETIDFAFKKGLISEWERSFYMSVLRKRVLSIKQLSIKSSVNQKLVKGLINIFQV
jgi:hypothetical protein